MGSQSLTRQPTHTIMDQIDSIMSQKQIKSRHRSVLAQLFTFKARQKYLFDYVFNRLKNREEIEGMLDQITSANLSTLDMLYTHTIVNKRSQPQGLCDPEQSHPLCQALLQTDKTYSAITIPNNTIEICELSGDVSEISHYEEYKQTGLAMIRSHEVLFLMNLADNNFYYQLGSYIEFQKIPDLPSQSSTVALVIKRLEALSKLIDTKILLGIVVSTKDKRDECQRLFSKLKLQNLSYFLMNSETQGCLDENGQLVLIPQHQVLLNHLGSGNLLSCLTQNSNSMKILSQYKYLHVINPYNLLQNCFDCFMLGKAKAQMKPFLTMAVNDKKYLNKQPVIYLRNSDQVHVSYPQESNYPQNCSHVFINNTIYSLEFIRNAMKLEYEKQREIRMKVYDVENQKCLQNYKRVFTYQREITDIFKVSRFYTPVQGTIVMVNSDDHFFPIYDEMALAKAVYKLSQIHKQWIGVKPMHRYFENQMKIVEIDPYVSIQGENLQDYQLSTNSLSPVTYITIKDGSEQGKQTTRFHTPVHRNNKIKSALKMS